METLNKLLIESPRALKFAFLTRPIMELNKLKGGDIMTGKTIFKILLICFIIYIFYDILFDLILIGLIIYGGIKLWELINDNFRLIKLNKPRHNHGRRKR